jgi:hypothetical protein
LTQRRKTAKIVLESLEGTPLNVVAFVVIEIYFSHFFQREIGPKLSTERWDDDMNCVVESKEVYHAEIKKCHPFARTPMQ